MRILHLIDLCEGADEPVSACLAAVNGAPGRHRVLALGSQRDVARAREAGLPVDAAAPPVGLVPEFSGRRLRRLIADRDGPDATRPWADVVQCWSPSALGLARLASGQRTPPRVGALLRPPGREVSGSAFRRLKYALHDATLFAPDRFTRSAWAEPASARRGGRRLEHNIRLLDPAPSRRLAASPDERVRAREHFEIEPDEFAIGLLADPPGAADIYRFSFILGLLFTTGVPVVGIVRRGADDERRSTRYVRLHGRRWGLRVTDRSTDFLLAACDLAMWDVGEPVRGGIVSAGAGSMLTAAAAGVPVVAARHPLSVEVLGSRAPELIARDATMSALAERVLWVRARGDAGAALARAAAPTAHSAEFTRDLQRLWEEVINTPIIRPGLPTPLALAARLGGAA